MLEKIKEMMCMKRMVFSFSFLFDDDRDRRTSANDVDRRFSVSTGVIGG